MYHEITRCRICGNNQLVPVLSLGHQALTGVFPRSLEEKVTIGPMELVKCHGDTATCCGLLQLRQSYESDEMYGFNYGYRSGLNLSMVRHLNAKVKRICEMVELNDGDFILDIGSNDGTLLKSYQNQRLKLVGIDPTVRKWLEHYPEHIEYIDDYFSASAIVERMGEKKAKVITSIAMFYDLERPLDFMAHVFDVLDDAGVWVFEQSYMPMMLKMNAYDTVCHEHLEYYRLRDIKWMCDRSGFKIIDVEFNDINGGSFSVTVAKKGHPKYDEATELISKILQEEANADLDSLEPYRNFEQRVFKHRDELIEFVKNVKREGKKIFGYGASTKGNVILQLCGFTKQDIPYIAEVNEDKFGSFTPYTNIPIVSEEQAKAQHPDYFLVLPWPFKKNFLQREKDWLDLGGKFVFPLPYIEVVGAQDHAQKIILPQEGVI